MIQNEITKVALEYYDRFVQYERNPISNSMKKSILDAIGECYLECQTMLGDSVKQFEEKSTELQQAEDLIFNQNNEIIDKALQINELKEKITKLTTQLDICRESLANAVKENENYKNNYHNRLLDIDELKRQFREERNNRKNESLK